MNEQEHNREAAKERAELDAYIRSNGDSLAKACEKKHLTDELVKATQRGYWSV